MKGYKHLSFSEREQIGRMYNKGASIAQIACYLDRSRQTIYNEIQRGKREQLNGQTWEYFYIYDPTEAQKDYREKAAAKGAALKIGNNHALAQAIENCIINEGRSPYDALRKVGCPFCVTTLYSYITKGIFLRLSNQHLPEKSKRKPRKYCEVKQAKRPPAGTSIDFRPESINQRLEPFHWEMDCVLGKVERCKKALLVFTERYTRAELIFALPNKEARSVVNVLNRLERKPAFREVFRSITVDNGSEFAYALAMEYNRRGEKRTSLYYCHPYSSFERGSNENANRLVRRKFPRGMSFRNLRQRDAREAMRWQNSIHRRLLGGQTAEQFFNELAPVPLDTFYHI